MEQVLHACFNVKSKTAGILDQCYAVVYSFKAQTCSIWEQLALFSQAKKTTTSASKANHLRNKKESNFLCFKRRKMESQLLLISRRAELCKGSNTIRS